MNKRRAYYFLIVLFFTTTAFVIIKYRHKENKDELSYYKLLNREGPLAQTQEWNNTRLSVLTLYRTINDNPADTKSKLALATIFIKEARVSGNYSYYDMAAMKQVNNVLASDQNNFQALTYKALIFLSQHHFADGLTIATKAQKINPYNAFIYGVLVDANVEMGKYDDAVSNAEKMVSIKPDLSSYSRISYLREIYGDNTGAIAAMKLAVEAGLPGNETTEWARIQLGHLYENNGYLDSAEHEYRQSLAYRNGYAAAIAGLGHIAFMRKDYRRAIDYYNQADTLAMDYTFKENLAAIYKTLHQDKKSDSLSLLVINAMNNDASAAANNDKIGHYVDRELANAYLTAGQNKKALEHALAEYNRRPGSIDVNQTVAWVYYKKKDYNKALQYIQVALKTNCKTPVLLCNAGLIYAKTNQQMLAKATFQEALKNNPCIDPDLKQEAEIVFKTL